MKGLQVVKDTVLNLSSNPGVYRMLNSLGDALYVGKAKNLKKRVVYYTKIRKLPKRHQRMVSETTSMEITTRTWAGTASPPSANKFIGLN